MTNPSDNAFISNTSASITSAPHSLATRLKPLNQAIKASLIGLAISSTLFAPAYANDSSNNEKLSAEKYSIANHNTAKQQAYQVPAGKLSYNLSRIASDAGIALSFDS